MKLPWLVLAMLLLAFSSAKAADMYSWTDAQGVKHFSDSPPPHSVKAQKLKVRGGVTSSTSSETEKTAESAGAGPAMAAAAGYSAEDIQRNCTVARKNLATLQAQQPALDESGEQVDAGAASSHQAQIDKANQQIALFCSGNP